MPTCHLATDITYPEGFLEAEKAANSPSDKDDSNPVTNLNTNEIAYQNEAPSETNYNRDGVRSNRLTNGRAEKSRGTSGGVFSLATTFYHRLFLLALVCKALCHFL